MQTENKVDNNDELTEEILHIEDIVAIIMVFDYHTFIFSPAIIIQPIPSSMNVNNRLWVFKCTMKPNIKLVITRVSSS